MPRSNRPSAYGPDYREAVRVAFARTESGGEHTLQFPDPNTAASLRAKFYAYFNALRTSEPHSDVARMVDLLSLRVAGSALVFFRTSDSWDARALREAMGTVRTPDPVVTDPHLEKLKELRRSK